MTTLGWGPAWRIARRDLHAGFRGLRLLFVCLFLGVATLAAIGSLTSAIGAELTSRGRTLLGGDLEVAMTQRQAAPAQLAQLRRLGTLSETIRTRAMAQAAGATPVLTELKGVDARYPLYGALTLVAGRYRQLAPTEVLVDKALAERLSLRPGSTLRYNRTDFTVAGIIADEPDRVGEGFTLGPVAVVSLGGLARTGLIQPGSLYESKYRLRLPPGSDAKAVREQLEQRFAAETWEYKDHERAAPGAGRFFERMGQFLALIGLAALVIAGIGVSNGVGSYLAAKRGGIATLKVLGARAADIERIYLLQVGAVAFVAIAVGLTVGAVLPPLIVAAAGDLLPVAPGFRLHPLPLATAAAFGLLIALIFTIPPVARARSQPAAAIFRSNVEARRRFDLRTVLIVGIALAAMVALALGTAREPLFSAVVLGAVAAALLLLLALGWALTRIARRLPRPRRPLLRLAIANLHRPGSQTTALVVALGLALTLFVTLAAIQTSLASEIARTVPKRAPNLFVLDIPMGGEGAFRSSVEARAPGATINVVPSLRGTITAYGSQRVADLQELPDGAWFLRGERGVTYSAGLPEGSELVAGRWWPADYRGPPLVSLDVEAATTLDLEVGDTLTVNVLGREIVARIASLRRVNWDTLGFNYVLVFSPSTLAAAPHNLTATITMPPGRDTAVTTGLLERFPSATVIAVRDLIGRVGSLLDQMASAIFAAAAIAILAGVAVLIGAIAAARQSRAYDAVILKTLGATRRQLLAGQALEFGLLALVLAALSLALGLGAAWAVIVKLFEFTWAPDWPIVLATLAGGALATLAIGLVGSLPLLAVRPNRALRQL
ncbi:ABC transporter permease [Sphingomonas mesophila]|uniref:ABC transporter permease n=1 Tax=Sphingomonas mesophila TaxID=2303576 RepID=UPI000E577BE8|nr:FtsX-like permease family protein [Sphingomonas mesophila]